MNEIIKSAMIKEVKDLTRSQLERMFIGAFTCLAHDPVAWQKAVNHAGDSLFPSHVEEFEDWQKELDIKLTALENAN